jgi:lipopolysaccharide/colanic/teichoic acid biosynthesis glycosyltransferase
LLGKQTLNRNQADKNHNDLPENIDSKSSRHEIEDKATDKDIEFIIQEDDTEPTIGKFLRKKGLDELPRLFDILKGEMSIGPLPATQERDTSVQKIAIKATFRKAWSVVFLANKT